RSGPARVRRLRRAAVRILPAGNDALGTGALEPVSAAVAAADQGGAEREPLPLHGIYENLRGGPGRGGDARDGLARAGRVRARGGERFGGARREGDRAVSIGDRFPKVDGPAKADGSGLYTDDISFPRMLHAKILR